MKLKLNRLAVGILVVVCVVLAMGALESSGPGRYQIASGDTSVWLVDTETGSVWVSEKNPLETDRAWSTEPTNKWYSYGSPGKSDSQ